MINKVNNDISFKAELVLNMKAPSKKRFDAVAKTFKEKTRNFPDKKFYISQITDDIIALHLNSSESKFFTDEVYTKSLKSQFKNMTDNAISSLYINSFRLLAFSEKHQEILSQIRDIKAKLKHNLHLSSILRKEGNTDYADKYEILAKYNIKKFRAMKQEVQILRKSFDTLQTKMAKTFPEILDVRF